MKIFVGNLAFEAKEADVYRLFMGFGTVSNIAIVMDKKGVKSRGFAFLEMPDDQEARLAIEAFNGKEFMGRLLLIEPARPKPESNRDARLKEKIRHKTETKTNHYALHDDSTQDSVSELKPPFKRTGGYRRGRRTLSYLKKQAAMGVTKEAVPIRKHPKDNPMRWRKKPIQPKPWQKKQEEREPNGDKQKEDKPLLKKREEQKPWQKKRDKRKPWLNKKRGERKPWQKSGNRKKHFRTNNKGHAHEKK